jgi:hypothetical protein
MWAGDTLLGSSLKFVKNPMVLAVRRRSRMAGVWRRSRCTLMRSPPSGSRRSGWVIQNKGLGVSFSTLLTIL